jgi:long-subunit acyl-CoA synthetase (AMP-forming)
MTSLPSSPRLDTGPALLAQQARERPDAVALRFKQRGLYQTRSWRALLDEALPAAPAAHALGLSWLLHAVHTCSAEAARWPVEPADVMWIEPALGPQGLAGWLRAGALLGVGEALDTWEHDLRELAPTVLIASAAWYDSLASEVLARAGRGSPLRRALLHRALAAPASWLAQRLVLRPLRDQLGLARTRLLLVPTQLAAPTLRFFEALELPVRALEPEGALPLRADAEPAAQRFVEPSEARA